jgi:hypothetical protein
MAKLKRCDKIKAGMEKHHKITKYKIKYTNYKRPSKKIKKKTIQTKSIKI